MTVEERLVEDYAATASSWISVRCSIAVLNCAG
jgi:hypothetical protein